MELRLHVRVFGQRRISYLLTNAKSVYDTAGITLDVRTENAFRDSKLSDVDLSTTELDDLMKAESFPMNEIAVYFLNSINPPMNGACFPGPLIIVTEMFTPWTLAHEIGHAFNLGHVPDNESVMGTTVKVQYPPPDFSQCELQTIGSSPLLFPDKILRVAMERDEVLNVLLSQEPDYDSAVQLGQEAIPHLEEIALEGPLPTAAKAVYLAGRIGGVGAGQIVASAAATGKPRPLRIAAAAGAAFLLPEHSNPTFDILLRTDDYGITKTALRSVPRGVSPSVKERVAEIANTTTDELLRRLAVAALQLQV